MKRATDIAKQHTLPLPLNSQVLNSEWLSSLLHVKVSSFKEEKLSGGCHGNVRRIQLQFQHEEQTILTVVPKVVVVKTLSWSNTFFSKVKLSVRSRLGYIFETKPVSYLKSYQIESHFYRDIAPLIKGINIPRIYYNYEDKFNNQFGLVMEDVTTLSSISGQPNGFTLEECKLILSKLARFHATFWNKDLEGFNMWNVGGYWTGTKRTSDKIHIVERWKTTLVNFSNDLQLLDAVGDDLAVRLYNNRQVINNLYLNPRHKTLIHGDFKIGNVFLENNNTNPEVHTIDWQWVGGGSSAIDVAYFLMTSTISGIIDRDSLWELVKSYYENLISEGVQNFSFEEMWKQFLISYLDFFVYVVSCKWYALDIDKINQNQQQCHDGMHIRTISHIQQLTILAQTFADELQLH